MALFTIILDHAGGTFIDQARGRSPSDALRKWAKALDSEMISILGKAKAQELVTATQDVTNIPTPVIRGRNVWCWTTLLKNKLALVYVIQTDAQ